MKTARLRPTPLGALVSKNLLVALVLLFAASSFTTALEIGDQVCIEGFVMDFFCINRGTLLDKNSLRTLEYPDRHSVHCLVDVGSCNRSPYEILLDPLESESLYARGWRLDDDTKDRVVNLARSIGSCSTCASRTGLIQGFRAALNATVLDLGSSTVPPLVTATGIVQSTLGENLCGQKSLGANGTDTGLFTPQAPPVRITSSGSKSLNNKKLAHGSLMLIGWGLLLPLGSMLARFLKHRPDSLWFKLHRVVQTVGLIVALAGWIIALKNFDVFTPGNQGYNSYKHGVAGMVTMCLGLLQPLNAVLRPHHAAPGGGGQEEAKTKRRIIWEYFHKGTGYAALLLAVVTIGYGTVTLADVDQQRTFQIAYGAGVGGCLLLVFAVLRCDKASYQQIDKKPGSSEESSSDDDAEIGGGEKESMLETSTDNA